MVHWHIYGERKNYQLEGIKSERVNHVKDLLIYYTGCHNSVHVIIPCVNIEQTNSETYAII